MAAAIPAAELFDAEFLESVQHLRIVARRVPRDGRFAEQRSKDQGAGIEFRDYRPYSPGDDLRAIDWNIYRRLGRVFLRLFEELEDLPVYLLPDLSPSMFVEEPPRALAGLRATLALAAISLNEHDTVGIFPFADDLQRGVRPQAGKGRVFEFAARLARLEPSGGTDLGRALHTFGGLKLRRGLAVVVSDFFDPRGADAVVDALKRVRHRLLLVRLVRQSDRNPRLQGDLRLLDCETGEAQDVSITAAVRQRYQTAFDRFEDTLASFARQRQAGLLRLDVEAPVVPQLAALFESGAYRA